MTHVICRVTRHLDVTRRCWRAVRSVRACGICLYFSTLSTTIDLHVPIHLTGSHAARQQTLSSSLPRPLHASHSRRPPCKTSKKGVWGWSELIAFTSGDQALIFDHELSPDTTFALSSISAHGHYGHYATPAAADDPCCACVEFQHASTNILFLLLLHRTALLTKRKISWLVCKTKTLANEHFLYVM